jgi:prolyl-tRNA editing enzyme YbaK/EbsC (Cys-tRNA(Pro) deacylase)
MQSTRQTLSASAQKVQNVLTERGTNLKVIEFTESTRTSAEAAERVGVSQGQIAKSLIFKAKTSGKPVLVIASGANRVDEKKIAVLLGEKIARADPDFAREVSGFVIGGIPPFGHIQPITTFLDIDLFQYEIIWAAAGTPNAVFELTPSQLKSLTGGAVVNVSVEKPEGENVSSL